MTGFQLYKNLYNMKESAELRWAAIGVTHCRVVGYMRGSELSAQEVFVYDLAQHMSRSVCKYIALPFWHVSANNHKKSGVLLHVSLCESDFGTYHPIHHLRIKYWKNNVRAGTQQTPKLFWEYDSMAEEWNQPYRNL